MFRCPDRRNRRRHGAVAAACHTAAQDLTRERVQLAIDITDRRIEQADALVSGADNDQARVELDLANSVQAEARRALSGSQLAVALRLTGEARVHADRAIAIVKGPNPDGVQAQLERTREILERANEQIQECDNPRARARSGPRGRCRCVPRPPPGRAGSWRPCS